MAVLEYSTMIAVFLPLAMAPVAYVIGKYGNRASGFFSTAVALITLLSVLTLFFGGDFIIENTFNFTANRLTIFIAFIPAFLGFLAMSYSIGYLGKHAASYYSFGLIFIGSMVGMALSWNLAWMYIFMEITTLSSAILVAHRGDTVSYEAALKYIFVCLSASTIAIIGIATLYSITGSFNLQTFLVGPYSWPLKVATISFVVGMGVKMAIFPLHTWLPDAHSEAPAPISTLLSGAMIKVGAYATFIILFKVAYVFIAPGITAMILLFGSLSMVIGVIMALAQHDLKRLLAYHSVSQMGYVIVGIGLGTPLGVVAGLFHLLNHSLFKGLLFLGAGSIEKATGVRDLNQMGGLAKNMPVTAATMLVASLAISGVPLLNGFSSKWMIFGASIEAGQPLVAVVGMAVSAFTLISFLKVMHSAFFGMRSNPTMEVSEAPYSMKIPMIVLAALCILFGVLPQLAINYWLIPASAVFVSGAAISTGLTMTTSIGLWGSAWATVLILLGLAFGFALYKWGLGRSPKIEKVDNKLLPFTGGMAHNPYLNIQDTRVNSTPFTFASTNIINFAKKMHPGLLNINILSVAIFIVIMIFFMVVV